jgi:hypothetical protein
VCDACVIVIGRNRRHVLSSGAPLARPGTEVPGLAVKPPAH